MPNLNALERYAAALLGRNPNALADVFTEDATLTEGPRAVAGRDRILEHYRAIFQAGDEENLGFAAVEIVDADCLRVPFERREGDAVKRGWELLRLRDGRIAAIERDDP